MLGTSQPLGGRSEHMFPSAARLVRELRRINVCDIPEMYESLRAAYEGNTCQTPHLYHTTFNPISQTPPG